MQDFEIYLPMPMNDGPPVDGGDFQWIKDQFVKAFGGYTHLNHRSEGAWRMCGVTFRDEVTIVRVSMAGRPIFVGMRDDKTTSQVVREA